MRGSRCCSTGHGVQARALLSDYESPVSKERPLGVRLTLVARLDLEHVDRLVTVEPGVPPANKWHTKAQASCVATDQSSPIVEGSG